MKKGIVLFGLLCICLTAAPVWASKKTIEQADLVAQIRPVRLAIVYEPPEWGDSGNPLSDAQVVSRFSTIIYSRTRMRALLPLYRLAGYQGTALQYLTALDRIAAPNAAYASPDGQNTYCSENDRLFDADSDTVNMDKGDFCEIQDAIVAGEQGGDNCLREYPDICLDESFFLHQQDGSRYVRGSGSRMSYRPNPASPAYRAYLVKRALREINGGVEIDWDGTERPHPASGATDIYLDNLELSWDKFVREGDLPPREFASSEAYAAAVALLVDQVHDGLPANTRRTVPLWANLISDPGEGDSWQIFIANNSLEGAFMEDFLLDWGRGAYDPAFALTQLEKVENWVQSGRKIVLVSQGDRDRGEDVFAREALYAFAASLLVTDGVDVAFKYDNYTDETGEGRSEHYNEYYEYPENLYRLGYPTSGRIGSATNPYVFQRKFQCGVVKVDLVSGRSQVSMTPCYPTITPLPAEEDSTEAAVLTGELTSKTTKNHATADKKK